MLAKGTRTPVCLGPTHSLFHAAVYLAGLGCHGQGRRLIRAPCINQSRAASPFSQRRLPCRPLAHPGLVTACMASWDARVPRAWVIDHILVQITSDVLIIDGGENSAVTPLFVAAGEIFLFCGTWFDCLHGGNRQSKLICTCRVDRAVYSLMGIFPAE